MTSPRRPPLPPPGWHPDPSGRHDLRYWDGTRWSEHVSDHGQTSIDHLTAAPTGVATTTPTATAGRPEPEPQAEPDALGAPPPSVPATAEGFVAPGAGWAAPVVTTDALPSRMRAIGGLAASLTVVLWITVAVAVFGVVAFANRVAVVSDILDFDFGSSNLGDILDLQRRADDADDLVGVAALLMLVCSVVIIVLLIIWMWRVAKNAELSGRLRPRFGPGWTIGGWFIPIANLVIPVLVMQDLWRASEPTTRPGDPDWRRSAGSALVGWWWALHLLAAFRFGGGGEAESRDELESLRVFDGLAAFGMIAAIAAAILLISVVRRITRRQEDLFAGSPVTPG